MTVNIESATHLFVITDPGLMSDSSHSHAQSLTFVDNASTTILNGTTNTSVQVRAGCVRALQLKAGWDTPETLT